MSDVESATARPLSTVSAVVEARHHRVVQDKPADMGGKDEGVMASEHLLVALLSCQLSTFVKVAAKRRLEATADAVRGDLHFEGGDIARVALHWRIAAGPGVADEKIEAALRLTDKACTISKALAVPVSFTFERA